MSLNTTSVATFNDGQPFAINAVMVTPKRPEDYRFGEFYFASPDPDAEIEFAEPFTEILSGRVEVQFGGPAKQTMGGCKLAGRVTSFGPQRVLLSDVEVIQPA